jgi:hypothetical protein
VSASTLRGLVDDVVADASPAAASS